jgi:hypothetical protein
VHQKGGSVENGKISPIPEKKRIGRAKRTACLEGNQAYSGGNWPVNMAAENSKRRRSARVQKLKKIIIISAPDLIEHFYADAERRLVHEEEKRRRNIGERTLQPRQMRPDIAMALAGYRYIDANKGCIIESRPEMHRPRRACPVTNFGKLGSHHRLIITVTRQEIGREIQRIQAFRNLAIALLPSVVHQITGQDKRIRPESL